MTRLLVEEQFRLSKEFGWNASFSNEPPMHNTTILILNAGSNRFLFLFVDLLSSVFPYLMKWNSFSFARTRATRIELWMEWKTSARVRKYRAVYFQCHFPPREKQWSAVEKESLTFLKLENVEDGTLSWHRLLKYSSFTDGDLTHNKKKTKQEKKKESRIKTRRGKRQKANSSSSPFQKNWIDKNISRKEASRYNNNSRVYQIVTPIFSLFSFDEAG